MFVNGLGEVAPADGKAVVPPILRIGDVTVPAENILFAGLSTKAVGLNQIDLRLPPAIRRPAALSIRQGSAESQRNVAIAVERNAEVTGNLKGSEIDSLNPRSKTVSEASTRARPGEIQEVARPATLGVLAGLARRGQRGPR